jgi:hypothetical protein
MTRVSLFDVDPPIFTVYQPTNPLIVGGYAPDQFRIDRTSNYLYFVFCNEEKSMRWGLVDGPVTRKVPYSNLIGSATKRKMEASCHSSVSCFFSRGGGFGLTYSYYMFFYKNAVWVCMQATAKNVKVPIVGITSAISEAAPSSERSVSLPPIRYWEET